MKVKHISIAVSLFAIAAGAMAVEAIPWNPAAGSLSRTEVKAELARAAANGELGARGQAYAGYIDMRAPQGTLARADVKQELARARASGELDGRNEAYGGVGQAHPQAPATAFAWRKLLHRGAKAAEQGSGE